MPDGNLLAGLRCLCENEVRFIVVGDVAAALHGAPAHSLGLDLVFSRESANIGNIMAALVQMDAFYRIQPERHLCPTPAHIAAGGHLKLITRFGPIDLMDTIGPDLGFDELLPQSVEMEIGQGMRVRVLNLETIRRAKEEPSSTNG